MLGPRSGAGAIGAGAASIAGAGDGSGAGAAGAAGRGAHRAGHAGVPGSRTRFHRARNGYRCDHRAGAGDGLAELVWSFRPAETPAPSTYADVPTTSPESVALSKELKRRGFTFVGPTTMFALMEAVGIVDTHLVGSHRRGTSGVWG